MVGVCVSKVPKSDLQGLVLVSTGYVVKELSVALDRF